MKRRMPYKTPRYKRNVGIGGLLRKNVKSIIVVVLLVLVGWGVFKFSKNKTIGKSVDYKEFIANYYEAAENEDWLALTHFYGDTLERFYGSYNISKIQVIKEAQDRIKDLDVVSKTKTIRWQTLETQTLEDRTELIFLMDYQIVRKKSKKPQDFLLQIVMQVDEEQKIISIYEDILSRK